MNTWGEFSLKNRATLHVDLQRVIDEALKTTNMRCQCGHRGEDAQNAAVANGTSKLRWPNSKHNSQPSLAVDLLPWPFDFDKDWKDRSRFARMMGHVESAAKRLGIPIRLGLDFDGDERTDVDEEWKDFPHVELKL